MTFTPEARAVEWTVHSANAQPSETGTTHGVVLPSGERNRNYSKDGAAQ